MAPTRNIFWCKVVFQKFIKHFRKMTDEQIVRDVRQSMDDIEDLVSDTDTFGACMVRWALERSEGPFATAARENGKKGGRPRKNPQDAPNGNAGVDGKSATSCDQFTADGDTREDSQAKPDGSAITRNETRANDALEPSANNCGPRQAKNGDASHSDAEDESATVSNPLALDMPVQDKCEQSAKTRDSRGSGRYQPPSLGPEDGNLFTTKKPSKISANGRRTGGPSLSQTSSLPPVRQSEPDVMSLAYSGEFGNVRLTQEQYGELGIKFGNQQKLNRAIDSLSCKLENDELKPVPRSHYAVLVKWANYRDDMDEKKELEDANRPPRYETVSEHNARVSRQADEWIREHFGKKEKRNG
jgi:hypothetical protein